MGTLYRGRDVSYERMSRHLLDGMVKSMRGNVNSGFSKQGWVHHSGEALGWKNGKAKHRWGMIGKGLVWDIFEHGLHLLGIGKPLTAYRRQRTQIYWSWKYHSGGSTENELKAVKRGGCWKWCRQKWVKIPFKAGTASGEEVAEGLSELRGRMDW